MDLLDAFTNIFGGFWSGLVWFLPKLGTGIFFILMFQFIMMVLLKWITKIEIDEDGYMLIDPRSWHFRFIHGKEVDKKKERLEYYRRSRYTAEEEMALWLSSFRIKMCPYAFKIWTKAILLTIRYSITTPLRWLLCIVVSIICIPLGAVRLVGGVWVPGRKSSRAMQDAGNPPYYNDLYEDLPNLFLNIGNWEKRRWYYRPIVPLTTAFVLYVYIKALIDGKTWVVYGTAGLILLAIIVAGIILITYIRGKHFEENDEEINIDVDVNDKAQPQKQRMLVVEWKSIWNKFCPVARVKVD